MIGRLALSVLLIAGAASMATAEPLAVGKALSALLSEGWSVVSSTGNGRPGEVTLIVRKDDKHAVCVLTEIRGDTYGEAKAKPQASPCLPLN